ncbi:MAG TPA: phosphonate ABC transporter, permease protein PhnE [Acetobacteraceae bacterium]|jgi:phosphonate transport system permease protein|nr:phosphonate ABC transporter, permease protein PhnE [Acetobacteraceae bacterium]
MSDAAAKSLRDALLAEREAVAARYADVLAPDWKSRGVTLALIAGAVAIYLFGLIALDISPLRLYNGMAELIGIIGLMLPPSLHSWAHFWTYLSALGQTLAIAFLGVLLAAIIGFPLGFLAAKNVVASRIVHFLARRGLDTIRSVDTLVWALIWINVVGLGPFAGALAITSADLGIFGKLFSEAIETADRKPVDGLLATGASRLEVIRFGILPQVLPVFASQVLYFFESDVRSATIIGIVGAGGIGLYLSEQIRVLEWQETSFIILMILVTVALIDLISQRLRAAMIGERRS